MITCKCVCVHACDCAVSCFELGAGWWTCPSQRDTAMFSFSGCFRLDVTLLSCTMAASEAEHCARVCLCMWVCVRARECLWEFFLFVPMTVIVVVIYIGDLLQMIFILYLHVLLCERPQKMLLALSGECVGEEVL